MTRNLLAKFKRPVQQSYRVVKDSHISQQNHQWQQLLASVNLSEPRRQSMDRGQMYRTLGASFENNRLVQKIPMLVRENQELRFKVQTLERQMHYMKENQDTRKVYSMMENRRHHRERELQKSIIKILEECRPIDKRRARKHSLSCKDRQHTESIDQEEEKMFKSATVNKKQHLSKQVEINFRLLEREKNQLKYEKETLKSQIDELKRDHRTHTEDIDEIQKRFQETLAEKEELIKRQKQIYEQKIEELSSKLTKLQVENQALKLQNIVLNQKLANADHKSKRSRHKAQPQSPNSVSNSVIYRLSSADWSHRQQGPSIKFNYR